MRNSKTDSLNSGNTLAGIQKEKNASLNGGKKNFKPGLKKITSDYCKQKLKWERDTRNFLHGCISELLDEENNVTTEAWNKVKEYREVSKRWEQQVLRRAAIRSRIQQIDENEEPSIYHFRKERINQAKNTITKIQTGCGTVTEDKTKIRGEITNYFQKLFLSQTKSFNSKDDFVTSMEGRAVFEDGMTKMVSEVEVKKVLDSKQKNKAPGIDGIPYAFYLTFWRLIKSEMTQMTNDVLNNGMITESQGTALIKLIPKHRKPKKITDYRPVSLLCTDYKIVAGVIAARLQITLQNSIGHEQVGGVPGRNIVSNLTTIRDTIQLVSERGTHGGLISVDLSKAQLRLGCSYGTPCTRNSPEWPCLIGRDQVT